MKRTLAGAARLLCLVLLACLLLPVRAGAAPQPSQRAARTPAEIRFHVTSGGIPVTQDVTFYITCSTGYLSFMNNEGGGWYSEFFYGPDTFTYTITAPQGTATGSFWVDEYGYTEQFSIEAPLEPLVRPAAAEDFTLTLGGGAFTPGQSVPCRAEGWSFAAQGTGSPAPTGYTVALYKEGETVPVAQGNPATVQAAGTYTARILPQGEDAAFTYPAEGLALGAFTLSPRLLTAEDFTATGLSPPYTGTPQTAAVTCLEAELLPGEDFTVEYRRGDETSPAPQSGTWSIVVQPAGNWAGRSVALPAGGLTLSQSLSIQAKPVTVAPSAAASLSPGEETLTFDASSLVEGLLPGHSLMLSASLQNDEHALLAGPPACEGTSLTVPLAVQNLQPGRQAVLTMQFSDPEGRYTTGQPPAETTLTLTVAAPTRVEMGIASLPASRPYNGQAAQPLPYYLLPPGSGEVRAALTAAQSLSYFTGEGTPLAEAPVNAGTYRLEVSSLAEVGGIHYQAAASQAFTILPRGLSPAPAPGFSQPPGAGQASLPLAGLLGLADALAPGDALTFTDAVVHSNPHGLLVDEAGDALPPGALLTPQNGALTVHFAPGERQGQSAQLRLGYTAPAGNYTLAGPQSALLTVQGSSEEEPSSRPPAEEEPPAPPVRVKSFRLPMTSKVLWPGQALTLFLRDVQPQSAAEPAVRYTSSRPAVATVEEATGRVTARKAGRTVITATVDGKTQKCTIEVKSKAAAKRQAVKSVKPEGKKRITLYQKPTGGEKPKSVQAKAKILPQTAKNKKVVWHSANPAIARVSKTGKITAGKKTGTTTVTCTTAEGGKSFTLRVTVKKK